MQQTTLTLHSKFEVGDVDERVFGGFMEHLGKCIYGGVYDPECAHADGDGFRTDVMAALRRLRMTAMRYPGGNFVSGYHWRDGVGPREARPRTLDLAWNAAEPNTFGTDEYVKLCRKMDWQPMIAVNLGTGSPEEAAQWVEYANRPAGTRFADMRVANGSEEPYGVRLWCLGNELDGPWQLGHAPAREYALRAQQAAKMMQCCDESIELVACGSTSPAMSTYMEWDREVLEYMGDLADHLAIHRYVRNAGDTADYLAVTNAIDRQIEESDAACRFVQAKRKSRKRAYLSFDEWGLNTRRLGREDVAADGGRGKHRHAEFYDLADAMVTAGYLMSFVRHADSVKIACLAQIVNVIAPLKTRGDELLLQSIFHPFEMMSKRREGVSLVPVVDGPAYDAETNGRARYVDACAILDAGSRDGLLHVFAANRSLDEDAPLRVELADRGLASFESGEILTGPAEAAANTFVSPHVVGQRELEAVTLARGGAGLVLPPLSFAAMTFGLKE